MESNCLRQCTVPRIPTGIGELICNNMLLLKLLLSLAFAFGSGIVQPQPVKPKGYNTRYASRIAVSSSFSLPSS